MSFNYSKLLGKIREVCGTQARFASAINISSSTLSQKLNNKVEFTQGEINAAMEVLGIKPAEIPGYFFAQEYEKSN